MSDYFGFYIIHPLLLVYLNEMVKNDSIETIKKNVTVIN